MFKEVIIGDKVERRSKPNNWLHALTHARDFHRSTYQEMQEEIQKKYIWCRRFIYKPVSTSTHLV